MHFCVFFSQHFVISTILFFSYIQTVTVGLGRKYQETSVPLNVELISSTDVKYNYKERRLFNRRKGAASFTLKSHFAHHICYTLDGSTPGCHDKSTNDNSKVHCKVVLSAKGDREPKEGWAHGGECKRSGIGDDGAWCASKKKQDSYLRIDLKKERIPSVTPYNQETKRTKRLIKLKLMLAMLTLMEKRKSRRQMWFTVDDGKKNNGNMPRGATNYWLFPKAVKARYFRIWPRMRKHPSLRINMLSKVEGTPAIVDKINYNVSIQLPDDSSTRDYAVKAIG